MYYIYNVVVIFKFIEKFVELKRLLYLFRILEFGLIKIIYFFFWFKFIRMYDIGIL